MEPLGIIAIGVGLVVMLVLSSLMMTLYRKAPPNMAMIITGMYSNVGNGPKIVVGGGTVILPLVQQVSYISLEVNHVVFQTKSPIYSSDKSLWTIEAFADIKVNGDDRSIARAAEHFLGKSGSELEGIQSSTLLKALIETVESHSDSELTGNTSKLAEEVIEKAQRVLEPMGLTVVTIGITTINKV